MHKHLHAISCPVSRPTWEAKYSNHDCDVCTCSAFSNPFQHLAERAVDHFREYPDTATIPRLELEVWLSSLRPAVPVSVIPDTLERLSAIGIGSPVVIPS